MTKDIFNQKPETLLDLMMADLYVNEIDGSITILHDKPFDTDLKSLEYHLKTGELLFKFEEQDIFFGVEFLEGFSSFLNDARSITVIQMEQGTKKPIFGVEVPLVLSE